MPGSLGQFCSLLRAVRTFARYDALMTPEQVSSLPWFARLALAVVGFGFSTKGDRGQSGLAGALEELGPSYIKLGQFLATRPDIVGKKRAAELRDLQDRMPPFPMSEACETVCASLGQPVDQLFSYFSPPVAAASIAQVHRAETEESNKVAVKILRPGIERRFANDLNGFYFVARTAEKWSAEFRRLRPVAAVDTLARSMKLELDLRMEASAIAEMAKNVADDPDFRIPGIDWRRTARHVLTSEWIDGTPLSDVGALAARGLDLPALGDVVIQTFLRHAIRDGFFHADMHPGNLFIDPQGKLVAVDFGIMGRLSPRERRFLAEILYGFITRDYMRVSMVHFEAGYVPAYQDPATFAQALRAIGEPIMDKKAEEISMARLLAQLFEVTGQFDMQTQPQLLLLQKTMVVVEGVARTLNPSFNMWSASEPVVREWIERKLGPSGHIENAADGMFTLGRVFAALPDILEEAQRATHMLADMANAGGIRLDRQTTEALAEAHTRRGRVQRYALVIAAAALVVIALKFVFR